MKIAHFKGQEVGKRRKRDIRVLLQLFKSKMTEIMNEKCSGGIDEVEMAETCD